MIRDKPYGARLASFFDSSFDDLEVFKRVCPPPTPTICTNVDVTSICMQCFDVDVFKWIPCVKP